jgi:CBS domain-containing protein
MKAQDVMTPNPVACRESDPIQKAVEIMSRHDTGVVPVLDNQNRCCGIVTDRDICLDVVLKKLNPTTTPLSETMHTNLLTCRPDDDLKQVIEQMKRRQVKRILVTENEYCVGIISEHDIVVHEGKEAAGELSASLYR